MNNIESIVRQSVLEDLGDESHPAPLNNTELEKQGKKPFKRKSDEIHELIEIDCDDSENTAKKRSLEKKRSTPLDSHANIATSSPLLSNLLQIPVQPQHSNAIEPQIQIVL